MFSAKIVLQKMKRNRRFSHLSVINNKPNYTYLKINGHLAYFKIGNCTRELAIFFKLF